MSYKIVIKKKLELTTNELKNLNFEYFIFEIQKHFITKKRNSVIV